VSTQSDASRTPLRAGFSTQVLIAACPAGLKRPNIREKPSTVSRKEASSEAAPAVEVPCVPSNETAITSIPGDGSRVRSWRGSARIIEFVRSARPPFARS
jgi:hypothetical protein